MEDADKMPNQSETYLKDHTYNIVYTNKDGEQVEGYYTPTKDTTKVGVMAGFKNENPDYFKLVKITESKKVESMEEITAGNIKKKAMEILPKEDIDTHDSDLYLKVSDKSTELVNQMKDKDSGLLSKFKSQTDGKMWYEIPFANMEDDYKDKVQEAIEPSPLFKFKNGDINRGQFDEIADKESPEYKYMNHEINWAEYDKLADHNSPDYKYLNNEINFGEYAKLNEGVREIMQGKELSVKDNEILDFVKKSLVSELGKDWTKKSLIDIEEITYDAVYEWGNNHDEEDIHAEPYYKLIRNIIETGKPLKEYIEKGYSSDPLVRKQFADEEELEKYITDSGYELLNGDEIDPSAPEFEIFDPAGSDGEVYVYTIKTNHIMKDQFDDNGRKYIEIEFNSKDSYNMNESKELTESDDTVTEYVITFTDMDKDDEIFNNQEDADKRFEELRINGEIKNVQQYFRKDWELNNGEYIDGYTEVFYTQGDVLEEDANMSGYVHIRFTDGSNPYIKFTDNRKEVDAELKEWSKNFNITIDEDNAGKVNVTAEPKRKDGSDLFNFDEDELEEN